MKRRILYTIPNFDTAGSGIPLLKIAKNLNKEFFIPEIACLHGKGDLFQDVIKSGLKVHFLNLYKKARPISRMLSECYQLSKIFKQINPDIIHSYHYAADYTEPLAAKMSGIKWIYTKKNMSWEGPSHRGWRLRSWLADGIICQNTDMIKYFFPNLRKANLIPIGVDTHEYQKQSDNQKIKKRWGIKDNSRIIITVANLVPVKGLEILINAFEELSSMHPDWRLMIAGDNTTQYGLRLKKTISNKQNFKEKVMFIGKQNNVREFLDISEIYVQPTLNKGRKEGAPIAVLEAMANGKVVLGSNIPGIRDQLAHFPNYMFKPGDVKELKYLLNSFMLNDKRKNIRLGEKFITHAKKYFDLSIEKKRLENYYKTLFDFN